MFEYNHGLYRLLHPETDGIFRAVIQGERNGELLKLMKRYDEVTHYHLLGVCGLCIDLGRDNRFSEDDLVYLGTSGLFHDIGKLGVPEKILSKPTRLASEEWKIMKKHPHWGADILNEHGYDEGIIKIILTHHEQNENSRNYMRGGERRRNQRYTLDGKAVDDRRSGVYRVSPLFTIGDIDIVLGDPRKCQANPEEERISRFSQILAVADVFDAITAERSYRTKPLSPDEISDVIWNQLGVDDIYKHQILLRCNEKTNAVQVVEHKP